MRPDGSLPGWNVFVGGNASGKSTILKAIALVLAGPTAARQLIRSTAGWITAGEKLGRAKLEIQWDHGCDRFRPGGAPPVSGFEAGLRWQRENSDEQAVLKEWEFRNLQRTRIQSASRGPWNPNAGAWFVCGYGPLRRLTGSSNEATRHALAGGKEASLVTLFYEDAALSESRPLIPTAYSCSRFPARSAKLGNSTPASAKESASARRKKFCWEKRSVFNPPAVSGLCSGSSTGRR